MKTFYVIKEWPSKKYSAWGKMTKDINKAILYKDRHLAKNDLEDIKLEDSEYIKKHKIHYTITKVNVIVKESWT